MADLVYEPSGTDFDTTYDFDYEVGDYDFTGDDFEFDFGAGGEGGFGFDFGSDYDSLDFENYQSEWDFSNEFSFDWMNDLDSFYQEYNFFEDSPSGGIDWAGEDFDYNISDVVVDATIGGFNNLVNDGTLSVRDLYGPIGGNVSEALDYGSQFDTGAGVIDTDLGAEDIKPVYPPGSIEDKQSQILDYQLGKWQAAQQDKDDQIFGMDKGELLGSVLGTGLQGLIAYENYQAQKDEGEKDRQTQLDIAETQAQTARDRIAAEKEAGLKELTKNIEQYNLDRDYEIGRERGETTGRASLFGVGTPEFEPIKEIDPVKYLGTTEDLKEGVLK